MRSVPPPCGVIFPIRLEKVEIPLCLVSPSLPFPRGRRKGAEGLIPKEPGRADDCRTRFACFTMSVGDQEDADAGGGWEVSVRLPASNLCRFTSEILVGPYAYIL